MIDWSAGTSDRGELSAEDEGIVELRLDTMVQVASLRYSTAFLHQYFFTFTLSNNLFRSSG